MDIKVIPVRTDKELNEFIRFPWSIYEGNKNWVPPLIGDMKKALKNDAGLAAGRKDREIFLAQADGKTAGRIYTGISHELNRKKNIQAGYISLFECIDDTAVSTALFDAAAEWFRKKGIETVRGPVSPDGADSDEYKGLLIDCFDRPPVLMNSYNPEYYIRLFENYGFVKDYDVFAYKVDPEKVFVSNPAKTLEYAKKRYNFNVSPINFKNVEEEVRAIKYVLDLAIPDEWPDLTAPSLEEVREIARKLIPIADPELIIIARSGDEPVGFGIAIPDYNQVLIHLNGRITPLAAVKYMWYKRKMDCARFFIMFVIPSFRKKGVSFSIYYQTFINALKKGFKWGEGSTIGEDNVQMRKDIESMGGEHYKTYRIYGKQI